MFVFYKYTFGLNCKHQFTYLQTIAKIAYFFSQKNNIVLIYVITFLCRKCPYKHSFIKIAPFEKYGNNNNAEQKHIKK